MSADVHQLKTRNSIGASKELLQSLVPRAQCFCFYDLQSHCVWSSDGVDDHEIDAFIADLPAEIIAGEAAEAAGLRRSLNSGRTALLMPVRNNQDRGLGALVTVFSKNAGKSSWFNPSLLKEILQPAVTAIGETIGLKQRLARLASQNSRVEDELSLVYKVDEKIHGSSKSHSGLAQLIGQSGRFLGIAYSVLLLPSKRIRISATHSSWKSVDKKAVDKYLVEQLFPQLEGKRSPVVMEIGEIGEVAGAEQVAAAGFPAMLCPLLDSKGNLEGVIAQLCPVSGEAFAESDQRFMSHIVRKVEYVIEQSFDSMTGLMNRSGFEAQLHESGKALGSKTDSHQIIYFDLDNLQLVNDTFGRSAGDQVLCRFAQLLEESLPTNAVATRLTGDEFAALLTHSTMDHALALAQAVRKRGDELRYLQGDKSLQITVSIGISAFDARSGEGDALTAARIACDSAKDHGRDRIEVHDRDDQSIIRRYDDMHLVAQLQQALDGDAFRLMAQPIVALTDDAKPTRFEILLRMRDAKGNRISSAALISAAERYQLMPQIDRWVFSTTMRQLAEYKELLHVGGHVFAVNLSGQTIGDDDFLSFVKDEFETSGVPPHCICFEVTESAAVSNLRKAQSFIDTLRGSGCQFALDDFGAGLSSFAYLKNFNVDALKIDGSFIRDIAENRISESMVAAITQVARVMELETVAEYVETPATKKLIRKLGVNFAQGHAVGKPSRLEGVLAELLPAKRAAEQ